MATISEPYPRPAVRAVPRSRLLEWVATTDHKKIGLLYLLTTGFFLLVGGLEALLMRLQLAVPRAHVLGPDAYNAVFTMHGTTMIFLVVMPMLLGFANYFVPLMIGARDMAFPKLNAMSYWLLLFGGLMLNFSFLAGAAPNGGWFAYTPLTEQPYTLSAASDYWALAILVTTVGSLATAVNLIVTVAKMRAPGMTAGRIPVFAWMSVITSFIILWAMPALTAAQVMLLFDRHLGTGFFKPAAGGDPLLWQHLFWFFGHPEVYIMVLPAFGMISEIVPVFSRKPIFGYWVIVGSGIAIAFYSFLVWAHHMFAVGMGRVPDAFFGAASLIIGVPTGIKIFSWLGTMWGGRLRLTTAMLFAIAMILNFTIGGITGIQFALYPIDWQVTDTYYVVAHFHYVLFGGTFLAMMGAIYYWFPKITGRMLDERLGKIHFWTLLVGTTLTFFPMHIVGLMGMPRRVYTYPDLPGWGAINLIETIGAFIIALATLILLWNIYRSLRHGALAGNNPWDAWTLEWATTSPPPAYNFVSVPPVRSARPLRDLALARANPAAASAPPTPGTPIPDETAVQARRGKRSFLDTTSAPSLATLVFITSEAFFFGSLIVTYLFYRHRSPVGPGPSVLDVPRTALFSIALFASSGTIVLAERYLRRERYGAFRLFLLATIALGAIFLVGQLTEYGIMYGEGVKIGTNLFTASFYTLTGFHGAHVTIGLIALAILAALGFAGDFRRHERHKAVEAVALYWHFVDAVWVVIFSLVYLWTLL